jgi:hypothetical protein
MQWTLGATVTLTLLWPALPAWAVCDPAAANGVNATCTGTTTNQGPGANVGFGLVNLPNLTVTVVPGATVTGTNFGVLLLTGTVFNSGTIVGTVLDGIQSDLNLNVTNFGTIIGTDYGIDSVTAIVNNSGIIRGGNSGVGSANLTITNSGTIWGVVVGINANTANVTNSGTIRGATALNFFGGNPDTLTLLPGSTILGGITLGGGGDTINFRVANQNLTFDTLAGATVTSTTPFAVSGTQIAVIDPTPFAAAGPLLTDFSRAASTVVPVFDGQTTVIGGQFPTAFAGPEPASVVAQAFASTGLDANASERAVFKSPTVMHADGSAVWARGFVGQRIQQADGVLLRNVNYYLGGAFGLDKQVHPGLRLGVFAGAGAARSTVDFNYGGTDSDLAFVGAYGRYSVGASYLKVAVQGGISRNDSTRNINNNLAPGGIETAKASYNGWYVSPEVTLGRNVVLGHFLGAQHTLTPSVQVRYLYASFDGYTETGSTANLTIGARTVENLEERAELKLTRVVNLSPSSALLIHIMGGALGVQRIGGDTVNASLLGQAIPFATPGKSNVWGGFGGLGGEFRNANVAVFASAEYLAMSDNSSVIGGKVGARAAF